MVGHVHTGGDRNDSLAVAKSGGVSSQHLRCASVPGHVSNVPLERWTTELPLSVPERSVVVVSLNKYRGKKTQQRLRTQFLEGAHHFHGALLLYSKMKSSEEGC